MTVGRLLIVALASPLLLSAPARAAPRWTAAAAAAGMNVVVLADDIMVMRAGRPVFSARRAAQADYEQAVRQADGATVQVKRTFTVVALAGPYLSLRDESYIELSRAAHPGGETRLWTIDLRRVAKNAGTQSDSLDAIGAGRLVDLRALVGEKALVRALARDPFVRRVGGARVATLDAVRGALSSAASARPDRCYDVPDDWTTRFAITGADASHLRVRVGLPGSGPCRYNLTQLGLEISIPPSLSNAIGAVRTPPRAQSSVVIAFGPITH